MVVLLQLPLGLFGAGPRQNGPGGQLHRPHPGEGPPGGLAPQQGGARLVKGQLQGVLHGVVDLLGGAVQLLGGKAGHTIIISLGTENQNTEIGQLLPPVEGKDGGVFLPAHVPGPLRVLGPLLREEGEHHLLGGIVIPLRGPGKIGGLKIQLHGCRSLVSLRPPR